MLNPFIPTYTKSGNQALDKVKPLILPPNSWLFITDANYMYNNINTKHAIKVITWWLKDLHIRELLPTGFLLDAVLNDMVIIMCNNIIKWGDLYFLQLAGYSMGTSAAVM